MTVPWSCALRFTSPHTFEPLGAYNTLLLPRIQLALVNFYLGIAKAASYTSKSTRGWPFSADPKLKGKDEFYVQEIYGLLQAKV